MFMDYHWMEPVGTVVIVAQWTHSPRCCSPHCQQCTYMPFRYSLLIHASISVLSTRSHPVQISTISPLFYCALFRTQISGPYVELLYSVISSKTNTKQTTTNMDKLSNFCNYTVLHSIVPLPNTSFFLNLSQYYPCYLIFVNLFLKHL